MQVRLIYSIHVQSGMHTGNTFKMAGNAEFRASSKFKTKKYKVTK